MINELAEAVGSEAKPNRQNRAPAKLWRDIRDYLNMDKELPGKGAIIHELYRRNVFETNLEITRSNRQLGISELQQILEHVENHEPGENCGDNNNLDNSLSSRTIRKRAKALVQGA